MTVKLSAYAAGAPATLIMFICNHCPFVVHLKPAITQLAREYQGKGVKVLAISSNSVETHPQDGPDSMVSLPDTLQPARRRLRQTALHLLPGATPAPVEPALPPPLPAVGCRLRMRGRRGTPSRTCLTRARMWQRPTAPPAPPSSTFSMAS